MVTYQRDNISAAGISSRKGKTLKTPSGGYTWECGSKAEWHPVRVHMRSSARVKRDRRSTLKKALKLSGNNSPETKQKWLLQNTIGAEATDRKISELENISCFLISCTQQKR